MYDADIFLPLALLTVTCFEKTVVVEFDGNLFALINKFSSIKTNDYVDSINGYVDTRRQKMTDILLKINDVLEKDYAPKERQYILLNGSRKNKKG